MLIPSIDLKGGRVVQLVQGERPAVEPVRLSKPPGRAATEPC